jgi:hypothetical protein
MSYLSEIIKIIIMESHGVEVNPHFTKEDLAMGAIDLYEEYVGSSSTVAPLRPNSSIIERAADLVKETAPQLIDIMVNNLGTPSPVNFGTPSPLINYTDLGTPSPSIPNVVISRLPETIIVLSPSGNTTTAIPQPQDQVERFV